MERTVGGYKILEKLGAGLQGKVYRGVSIATGEVVALKFISQESVASNPRNVANLQREIEAMQLVSGHPHTVGVKQVLLDVSKERKRRPGQFKKCILLVLEICGGGELFDYLMTCGKFEENLARTYFIQMMEALHYAHSKNVAHRDIKPENLLIDNHLNLRVADWGLSAVRVEMDAAVLKTQCGTRAYMAPELLRREFYRGETADVWSAGVVLFIMLAGFPPFQQASPGDWWYDRVAARQYDLFWSAHERSVVFSADLKALLNSMFVADPARRYRVEDCLKHAWSGRETLSPEALLALMRVKRSAVLASKGRSADEAMAGDTTSDTTATLDDAMSFGGGSAFEPVVVRCAGAQGGADVELQLPRSTPVLPSATRRLAVLRKAGAAAVDDSAPLPSPIPAAVRTLEAVPADYPFAAKRTWLFLRSGVAPTAVGSAVFAHVKSKGGSVVSKARPDVVAAAALTGAPSRVKLLVAFPTAAGDELAWDVKLYDGSALAGGAQSAGIGLMLDITKTAGDSLGSNREFEALAASLRAAGLLAEGTPEQALTLPTAAPSAPNPPTAILPTVTEAAPLSYSVLPARSQAVFASDQLRVM